MFDFHVTRSKLLALRKDFLLLCRELFSMRENLLMQRQDECLQGFGIELIEIGKSSGIHRRHSIAVSLQHDENAPENTKIFSLTPQSAERSCAPGAANQSLPTAWTTVPASTPLFHSSLAAR